MKKYYIVGNRAFETFCQASEYCEENDLDGETMIIEVTDGERMADYYDKTTNYNVGYNKDDVSLKTVYTIEYITDKRDFDRVCSGKHDAPWELYKTYKTDSLQQAMTVFLAHYASDRTYDVKLFEEIHIYGELIREQCITDIMSFGRMCDRNEKKLADVICAKDEIIKAQAAIVEEMEVIKRAFGRDQYEKFIRDQRAKMAG